MSHQCAEAYNSLLYLQGGTKVSIKAISVRYIYSAMPFLDYTHTDIR